MNALAACDNFITDPSKDSELDSLADCHLPRNARQLRLGSRAGGARPAFDASVGARAARVELDTSAVFKLGRRMTADDIDRILQLERPRIRIAAQRLLDEGFVTRNATGIEIILTALDL